MGVLDKLKTEGAAKRSVTTSVRFTESDLQRLDDAAKSLSTTRSKLIYESAMETVAKYERLVKREAK